MDLVDQQRAYFAALVSDRAASVEALKKPSMRGIWDSVIEKYSDLAHFVYELLQNADDVEASEARFGLEKDGLVFAHNGKVKFSISDPSLEEEDNQGGRLGHLNAITSIGQSSKKEAQIGKFGVGFKAVFQYSAHPQVYCPPFIFRLENMVVPVGLDCDHPERKDGETLFYFPFDHPGKSPELAFKEISEKLSSLEFPLLFLRNLGSLKWEIEGRENGSYRAEVLEELSVEGRLSFYRVRSLRVEGLNRTVQDLLLFRSAVPDPDRTGLLHRICLAMLIDGEGKVMSGKVYPAYCFFPTKETTHLRFMVHAPFLLTDSREGIHRSRGWNEVLINELAGLLGAALPLLKRHGYLDLNTFKAFPLNGEYFDHKALFGPMFSICKERLLAEEALLPKDGGGWVHPEEAYLAGTDQLGKLFNGIQLGQLLGRKEAVSWVFPGVTRRMSDERGQILAGYLRNVLGVKELTPPNLVSYFHKEFFELQTVEWIIAFYTYFGKLGDTHNDLKKREILVTTHHGVLAGVSWEGKAQVYLPTGLGSEYPTVAKELVNDETLRLLKGIGLDEPKVYDEILHHIFPRYQGESSFPLDQLEEDFRKLYDHYQNGPQGESWRYEDELRRVKFCLGSSHDGGKNRFLRGEELYFDLPELRRYFEGDPEVYFLKLDFYQRLGYKEKGLFEFFKKVGVRDLGRVEKLVLKGESDLEEGDVDAIYQKLPSSAQNIRKISKQDFDLHGLSGYLNRADWGMEDMRFLWGCCIRLLKDRYPDPFKAVVKFYWKSEKEVFVPSELLRKLRSEAWVFSGGKCSLPGLVTQDQLPHDLFKEDYYDARLMKLLGIYSKDDEAERLSGLKKDELELLEWGRTLKTKGITHQDIDELEKIRERRQRRKERSEGHTEGGSGEDRGASAGGTEYETESESPDIEDFLEKERKKLEERMDRDLEEFARLETLKRAVGRHERYSYGWMLALIELEYYLSSGNHDQGREISVSFGRVVRPVGSERLLELSQPSRHIPYTIEDSGSLNLKVMVGREIRNVGVEVVSVKGFVLRAKVNSRDQLEGLDLELIRSATLEIQNPLFLLEELLSAFRNLRYEPTKNLKADLPENLEFVFGPPGTGKTTHLGKERLIPWMLQEDPLKILVLTPTNKAADVLTRKVIEECPGGGYRNWLIRFESTQDPELESKNLGVLKGRRYDIRDHDRCVVVSTVARFAFDGFTLDDHSDDYRLRNISWDIIVFDEASMIMLGQISYVIFRMPDTKFLIAGDPFQIEPVVQSDLWAGENIYSMIGLRSFSNPATEPHEFPIHSLERQFRSRPSIGEVFSRFTYDGILKHYRNEASGLVFDLPGIELGSLNLVQFPVKPFASIYRAQKLNRRSSYHVESALLAVEFAVWILKHQSLKENEKLDIGIICPYKAQAVLIEQLVRTHAPFPSRTNIVVGTVHAFQGDECEVVFAVFNPPPYISGNEKMFLNRQNILNVAISRARDYLFVFAPDEDTERLSYLQKLNGLISLMDESSDAGLGIWQAGEIELLLFDQEDYLFQHTFMTGHQEINVYSELEGEFIYEVRTEEDAVDVQVRKKG